MNLYMRQLPKKGVVIPLPQGRRAPPRPVDAAKMRADVLARISASRKPVIYFGGNLDD